MEKNMEEYVKNMKGYEEICGKYEKIMKKHVGSSEKYRMAPSSPLYIAYGTWKNSELSHQIYTWSVHVKKAKN